VCLIHVFQVTHLHLKVNLILKQSMWGGWRGTRKGEEEAQVKRVQVTKWWLVGLCWYWNSRMIISFGFLRLFQFLLQGKEEIFMKLFLTGYFFLYSIDWKLTVDFWGKYILILISSYLLNAYEGIGTVLENWETFLSKNGKHPFPHN
jgi:hypothetical protein